MIYSNLRRAYAIILFASIESTSRNVLFMNNNGHPAIETPIVVAHGTDWINNNDIVGVDKFCCPRLRAAWQGLTSRPGFCS